MREKSFLKDKCKKMVSDTFEEDCVKSVDNLIQAIYKNKVFLILFFVFALSSTLFISLNKGLKEIAISEVNTGVGMAFPVASVSSKKSIINIPSGVVKRDPFLPYRDLSGVDELDDIPAYNLVEPPLASGESSEAARIMDTIVSGILYDRFSPSAILNIEGNDYLVKKGDVVNNYKVLNIAQDSVTVGLGANVYKAGIGEILTEGTLNHNNVSNLNNKFGGEK